MKHFFTCLIAAALTCVLASTQPAFAICQDLNHLSRILDLTSYLLTAPTDAQMADHAASLDFELTHFDPSRVQSFLDETFQDENLHWVDEAIGHLHDLQAAAALGDRLALIQIAEIHAFNIALSRLRLAEHRSNCAAEREAERDGNPAMEQEDLEHGFDALTDLTETDGLLGDRASHSRPRSHLLDGPLTAKATAMLSVSGVLAIVLGGLLALVVRKRSHKLMIRRRAPRKACKYDTVLHHRTTGLKTLRSEGGSVKGGQTARVIDVNQFGASLTQPATHITQGAIRFRIGEDWVEGIVRWHNHACFGVEVLAEIAPAQLALVVQRSADIALPFVAFGTRRASPNTAPV